VTERGRALASDSERATQDYGCTAGSQNAIARRKLIWVGSRTGAPILGSGGCSTAFAVAERRAPVREARHLLPDPHPEIPAHADSRPAVAGREMDALVPADVHQFVECVADEAAPRVADPQPGKGGEDLREVRVQYRSADRGVGLAEREAAEQDAAAVTSSWGFPAPRSPSPSLAASASSE